MFSKDAALVGKWACEAIARRGMASGLRPVALPVRFSLLWAVDVNRIL